MQWGPGSRGSGGAEQDRTGRTVPGRGEQPVDQGPGRRGIVNGLSVTPSRHTMVRARTLPVNNIPSFKLLL